MAVHPAPAPPPSPANPADPAGSTAGAPRSPRSPLPQPQPQRLPQPQFLPPHISIDAGTGSFTTTTSAALSVPLGAAHPNGLRRQRRPPVPGAGAALSIDDALHQLTLSHQAQAQAQPAQQQPKPIRLASKSHIRRDSLRQREALLKGKEGSRRRQRWENDRLLHNPYLTPPTPADFLPCPTHVRKVVHYDLACLWDHRHHLHDSHRHYHHHNSTEPQIPREFKMKLKRARGAVGMVRMLEERVREFITAAARPTVSRTTDAAPVDLHLPSSDEAVLESHRDPAEPDKEDIVFTPKSKSKPRHHPTHRPTQSTPAITPTPATTPPPSELPIYHSPPTDPSAPFIRWLVHSIAEYYGLRSWSVTMPEPGTEAEVKGEVRVAYVGLTGRKEKEGKKKKGSDEEGKEKEKEKAGVVLPRPLWVML
ncbi:hypothetical protein BDZ91DRAFT_822901 [Kalaharituber pfeilii]|nr:hypothetical protein BDZ91DRAFT_822901 [Kalaharituber pfeilii]